MKLNTEALIELKHIDLLSNIGTPYTKYLTENTLKKVLKSLESRKWENIGLEEEGKLTEYLSKNHREEYREWNNLVAEAKANLIPEITKKLDNFLKNGTITVEIVDAIKWDFIGIVLALSYKDYFHSEFYEKIFEIYRDGHLPCGWIGKYPKGTFRVY